MYNIIVRGDTMKRSELVKILKKHGCKFIEHGGNHDKFYSPLTGKTFPVWRHAKDIPPGTARAIFKQAGIE
nr:MAG TPA: hypothetical protein [Caudoviricetes sp.]